MALLSIANQEAIDTAVQPQHARDLLGQAAFILVHHFKNPRCYYVQHDGQIQRFWKFLEQFPIAHQKDGWRLGLDARRQPGAALVGTDAHPGERARVLYRSYARWVTVHHFYILLGKAAG
jgi:hypothetical protein